MVFLYQGNICRNLSHCGILFPIRPVHGAMDAIPHLFGPEAGSDDKFRIQFGRYNTAPPDNNVKQLPLHLLSDG
jgi:hypothetical protein